MRKTLHPETSPKEKEYLMLGQNMHCRYNEGFGAAGMARRQGFPAGRQH